jgi:hypothetical protein
MRNLNKNASGIGKIYYKNRLSRIKYYICTNTTNKFQVFEQLDLNLRVCPENQKNIIRGHLLD